MNRKKLFSTNVCHISTAPLCFRCFVFWSSTKCIQSQERNSFNTLYSWSFLRFFTHTKTKTEKKVWIEKFSLRISVHNQTIIIFIICNVALCEQSVSWIVANVLRQQLFWLPWNSNNLRGCSDVCVFPFFLIKFYVITFSLMSNCTNE